MRIEPRIQEVKEVEHYPDHESASDALESAEDVEDHSHSFGIRGRNIDNAEGNTAVVGPHEEHGNTLHDNRADMLAIKQRRCEQEYWWDGQSNRGEYLPLTSSSYFLRRIATHTEDAKDEASHEEQDVRYTN